jgi:hypothetical protein
MYLHATDLQILQQSGNILTNVPPQISFLKAQPQSSASSI